MSLISCSFVNTVVGQFLEQLLILLVHVLDGEQPVGQLVLARVRVGKAQVHELVGRAHQQEVGQREFQIAGEEDELVGLRVEVQMIVVPQGEEAFQVRRQCVGGQEAQELVHVEERVDLLLELARRSA